MTTTFSANGEADSRNDGRDPGVALPVIATAVIRVRRADLGGS
jgi:hypothetical protein